MQAIEHAKRLLAADYGAAILRFRSGSIEEIRLRLGRAPYVLIEGQEQILAERKVEDSDLYRLLETATGASIHTAGPSLAEGYMTYKGLRIGVCGTAILREGHFSGFRSYTSAAIRIPTEHPGICDDVLPGLLTKGFRSTLILSPPGGGKTTALREIICGLSRLGYRVGVVDERSELAMTDEDGAHFDLGEHSDVVTGADKAQGAMMLLRGMNPQIIAMDEISSAKDLPAVEQICGCGVSILASAHAADLKDLMRRDMYKQILDKHIFQYLVTITGIGAQRQYWIERTPD